jgi:hypothetical protein
MNRNGAVFSLKTTIADAGVEVFTAEDDFPMDDASTEVRVRAGVDVDTAEGECARDDAGQTK